MEHRAYRGHRVRTYASFHGPWWAGAFQIDAGVVVIHRGSTPAYDMESAHSEAYGLAMDVIDAQEGGRVGEPWAPGLPNAAPMEALSAQQRGAQRLRPCRADPRFGYVLVPPSARAVGLVVAIHDSTRDLEPFVDGFSCWAGSRGLALLVPHFPAGVRGDGHADGYKFLHEGDIRYDVLLDDMVAEASAALGCPSADFLLQGYSGGAQFAHRYLLLHPQRVRAASIGAPGEVTLLDEDLDWWGGIRDAKRLFGLAVQPATMRRTPIQLLVGERDTSTEELVEQPPSRFWASDEIRLRANRIDRLRTLHDCLSASGAHPGFELMPGMAHGSGAEEAIRRSQRFFESV